LASPSRVTAREWFGRRFLLIALTTTLALLLGAPPAAADTTSWMTGPVPMFGRSSSIAADTTGNVYAYDAYSGMIKKYTGTGAFLGTVGPRTAGVFGLAASPDGGVYALYANTPSLGYAITKYDGAGTAVQTIPVAPGQAGRITGFGADGAGNVYILDAGPLNAGSGRVEKFLANGSYSTQWGQFDFINNPGALGVGRDGTVYVSDATNRIQRFTSTGAFLGAWGSTGTGLGQFVSIGALAVDSAGHVYASDPSPRWTGPGMSNANGPLIQAFDSSGNYLGSVVQGVGALTTYGNNLVYGMYGDTVYRFELTIPNLAISLFPGPSVWNPTPTVQVGQPLAVSARASVPFGSITGFSFDFGAGGPAVTGSSATATNSYMTAGTYRVTVKATTARGGSATTYGAVVVTSPPPPRLSALSVAPNAFRAARSGGSTTTSPRLGTKVNYKLTVAASIRFTIQRAADGRRVGGRCQAPARNDRNARHCTRFVTLRGSFTMAGRAGKNNFRFGGRLNRVALAPGNYRLIATPSALGATGIAQMKAFTILR
jgi:hypothetical protein